MTQGKMKMGYVEVATQQGCRLFPAGATVRGHVFHFSEMVCAAPYPKVLSVHVASTPATVPSSGIDYLCELSCPVQGCCDH